jgi:hypothetical protein
MAPLAPQHTGFTITKQPTLYWYLSQSWDAQIEFTLNKIGAIEPILELTIGLPYNSDVHQAGMHHLRLADYDVHLEPDQEYEWFIVIVSDPEQRSNDWLASGTIRYIKPSNALTKQLSQTSQKQWYKVYAENGIWYDAIDNISMQIEKQPFNKELRRQRASLIEQVAMPKVARYEQ